MGAFQNPCLSDLERGIWNDFEMHPTQCITRGSRVHHNQSSFYTKNLAYGIHASRVSYK